MGTGHDEETGAQPNRLYEATPQTEAALCLLRRALSVAAEDGSWEALSDEVRGLLTEVLLPSATSAQEIVDRALDDASWCRALLVSTQDALRNLEVAADLIPGHLPLTRYNRSGVPLRQHTHDVAAVKRVLERRFAPVPGDRLDNLIHRLDAEGLYTDADICADARDRLAALSNATTPETGAVS